MILRKRMWALPLSVVFWLVFTPIAFCDFYWEYQVVSGGEPDFLPKDLPKDVREQMLEQMNLKPTNETQRCYQSPKGFRSEQTDGILIIDYDTMTMYQLDHLEKTYTKFNMIAEIEGNMGQMAREMAKESKMTPTNETKEIAGYTCRKYIVTMMGAENE